MSQQHHPVTLRQRFQSLGLDVLVDWLDYFASPEFLEGEVRELFQPSLPCECPYHTPSLEKYLTLPECKAETKRRTELVPTLIDALTKNPSPGEFPPDPDTLENRTIFYAKRPFAKLKRHLTRH